MKSTHRLCLQPPRGHWPRTRSFTLNRRAGVRRWPSGQGSAVVTLGRARPGHGHEAGPLSACNGNTGGQQDLRSGPPARGWAPDAKITVLRGDEWLRGLSGLGVSGSHRAGGLQLWCGQRRRLAERPGVQQTAQEDPSHRVRVRTGSHARPKDHTGVHALRLIKRV